MLATAAIVCIAERTSPDQRSTQRHHDTGKEIPAITRALSPLSCAEVHIQACRVQRPLCVPVDAELGAGPVLQGAGDRWWTMHTGPTALSTGTCLPHTTLTAIQDVALWLPDWGSDSQSSA